jgi:hypothetical protein
LVLLKIVHIEHERFNLSRPANSQIFRDVLKSGRATASEAKTAPFRRKKARCGFSDR